MPDEKSKEKLAKKIKVARALLIIYGIFGMSYGIYFIIRYNINLIYGLFNILYFPLMGPLALLASLSIAIPILYIIGALKEFSASNKLLMNTSLGAKTGILGQILIGVPSFIFIFFNIEELDRLSDNIGYVALLLPIIGILYNIYLYSNLRLLKKFNSTKSSTSNK